MTHFYLMYPDTGFKEFCTWQAQCGY